MLLCCNVIQLALQIKTTVCSSLHLHHYLWTNHTSSNISVSSNQNSILLHLPHLNVYHQKYYCLLLLGYRSHSYDLLTASSLLDWTGIWNYTYSRYLYYLILVSNCVLQSTNYQWPHSVLLKNTSKDWRLLF